MQSQLELTDNEVQNTLPPMITNNIREKIYPEQISLDLIITPEEKHDLGKNIEHLQHPTCQIVSSSPINVVYYPKVLNYEIQDITTVHSLRVWNASMRSLYVTCNGLHNNSEDIGFILFSYPRTRYLLAPGLATTFYMKATPKSVSSVRSLRSAVQLSAAHKRDTVVTYFSVPIVITFLKYIAICPLEGSESISFLHHKPSI